MVWKSKPDCAVAGGPTIKLQHRIIIFSVLIILHEPSLVLFIYIIYFIWRFGIVIVARFIVRQGLRPWDEDARGARPVPWVRLCQLREIKECRDVLLTILRKNSTEKKNKKMILFINIPIKSMLNIVWWAPAQEDRSREGLTWQKTGLPTCGAPKLLNNNNLCTDVCSEQNNKNLLEKKG